MECLKQSSPSVFICPENEYFTNNHTNAVQMTYRLQKVEKELKKKTKQKIERGKDKDNIWKKKKKKENSR